jgi:hypothetical protein
MLLPTAKRFSPISNYAAFTEAAQQVVAKYGLRRRKAEKSRKSHDSKRPKIVQECGEERAVGSKQ